MKKIVGFISLLAILLSTFGVAYAQAPDPGSGTSYGAVQNVDSTGAATFRQDFYDAAGTLDATRSKAGVATGDTMGLTTNQTTDAPLDAALPTGWVRSSVVSYVVTHKMPHSICRSPGKGTTPYFKKLGSLPVSFVLLNAL